MRLWSLHPAYLDPKGLVALWREGLLAQAVLLGRTKGYRFHPQLERFKAAPAPAAAVAAYLRAVAREAASRGYRFDESRISGQPVSGRLRVTDGQLELERRHLLAKCALRAPERCAALRAARPLRPHPLFRVVAGGPAVWERAVPKGRP